MNICGIQKGPSHAGEVRLQSVNLCRPSSSLAELGPGPMGKAGAASGKGGAASTWRIRAPHRSDRLASFT
jgi:hypothetical protein